MSSNLSSDFMVPSQTCGDCAIDELKHDYDKIHAQDAVDHLLAQEERRYAELIEGEEGRLALEDELPLSPSQSEAAIVCAQRHKCGACVVKLS